MATNKSIEELLKDPTKIKTTAKTQTSDEETAEEKLGRKMANIKIKEKEVATKQSAQKAKYQYIDLVGFPISPDTISTIPKEKAKNLQVICFLHIGPEIRIGAIKPDDPKVKELAFQVGEQHQAKVEIYQISENSFELAYKLYEKIPVYKKPPAGVEISAKELAKYKDIAKNFRKLHETIQKTNITELVTLIVAAALQANASDIHIEAEEKDVKVRFRIDGVLHDVAEINKKLWPKVISRIKLLAKLKINITDKPQDGRFSIILQNDKIDVRVSTVPTSYGESVVSRLLTGRVAGFSFEDLGLVGQAYKNLKHQAERPNGMILTTGPTGSGKTTTLYATLNKLNDEATKILTLEDPIEYRLEGINQSQIDRAKSYSFADGLRSILRQDPDIIMVGEIRDLETADVAINAALTGHLVLSTVHTNSAAGAVPRLMAMGVKGFLMAPAINAIIGQRLVRKICTKCKTEYKPSQEEMDRVKKILAEIPNDHPDKPKQKNLKFYQGKGCKVCNELKYQGRIGIYEIMIMTKDIEKTILDEKVSEFVMQDLAIKNGMLTMAQDGLIKALQGTTTIEEVFRVSE